MSFSALIITGGGGGQSFGMSLTQRFLDDFISLHHHQCYVFSISQQYTNHTSTQEKENLFQFDFTGDATTQLVFLGTITVSGLYLKTRLNCSLVVLFPQLQRGHQELKQRQCLLWKVLYRRHGYAILQTTLSHRQPLFLLIHPGNNKEQEGEGVSVSPLAPGPLSLVKDGPWGTGLV